MRGLVVGDGDEDYPVTECRVDQVPVPESWVGQTVMAFQQQTGGRIAWIDRLGEGFLPTRESMLQEGDLVHFVMRDEDAGKAYKTLDAGPEEH